MRRAMLYNFMSRDAAPALRRRCRDVVDAAPLLRFAMFTRD